MKLRLTISGKLGLGFGLLTIVYLSIAIVIFKKLESSQEKNSEIKSIFEPSVSNLLKLQNMVSDSRKLLKNWVFVEKESETPDKLELFKIL
jgi:methyl-accepting chemotaxis protein